MSRAYFGNSIGFSVRDSSIRLRELALYQTLSRRSNCAIALSKARCKHRARDSRDSLARNRLDPHKPGRSVVLSPAEDRSPP